MSGNKAFIDTSAILRLLVKDDSSKADAVKNFSGWNPKTEGRRFSCFL